MIVKCKSLDGYCPMILICLARLSDPTITGCGVPLWADGKISKQEIMVEHTVRGGVKYMTREEQHEET